MARCSNFISSFWHRVIFSVIKLTGIFLQKWKVRFRFSRRRRQRGDTLKWDYDIYYQGPANPSMRKDISLLVGESSETCQRLTSLLIPWNIKPFVHAIFIKFSHRNRYLNSAIVKISPPKGQLAERTKT